MTRDLPDTPSPGRRKRRSGAWPAALAAGVLLSACALLAAPPAGAQEAGVRKADGLVFFNLQNVDIRSALESISEVLGISYVLGGSVPTGTPITISTAAGIPLEKVPDLLDSVLRTYNLALIKTGDVFTVIQAGEAGITPEAARTEVYVYYLRNANAVDLANVLTQLFQGTAPPGGFTRRTPTTQGLSRRLEQQTMPFAQVQPYDQEGQGQVTPEQQQANVVTRVIPGELVGQTSIVPDETTNSLIIKTAPENYASLQETIGKLDIRPAQVLIEVTIAEITLDKSSQFGIEYLLKGKTDINGETVRGEFELSSPTPIVGGLRARVFDSGNVDVTLRALAADSRINVLSTPRVLAVNNHEARILIGSEVPFVQFSRATTGEAIDQVVQYRNVGLELTVTPRINPDRYISMDLLQQVSALTNDVLFDAPIITTREAQTSLVVGDNQTVVLGGLMDDRKEKRRNGIPILKDIPVLGWLFGTTSERTVKTELVLTLTPYIVESDEELQGLRREIESHSELYGKELEKRREAGHFVPGDLTPERLAPPPDIQDGTPVPAPAPADTSGPPPPADSLSPVTRKDSPGNGPAPTARAPAPPGEWPAVAALEQVVEVPAADNVRVSVSGATVLPSGPPAQAPPGGPPSGAGSQTNLDEALDGAGAKPSTDAEKSAPAAAGATISGKPATPAAEKPAAPAAPATPAPRETATPEPAPPELATAAPTTPEPATPEPTTLEPTTLEPTTPTTPEAATPEPTTLEPTTPEPTTPEPTAPGPTTPEVALTGRATEAPTPQPATPAAALMGEAAEPATSEGSLAQKLADTAREIEVSGNADAPRDLATARGRSEVPAETESRSPAETKITTETEGRSAGETPASEAARQGYRVQVAAVPQADLARQVAERVQERLGMAFPVYVQFFAPLYKVRVGDFPTRTGTQDLAAHLRDLGYEDAWTVRSPIRGSQP